MSSPLDALDRRLIAATEAGLPLVARPYDALAEELGVDPLEVRRRLAGMLTAGIIRRIGVVPNHYALGYRANAMTVWDVDDARVAGLGARVGALDCVSHCYRRPRHPPSWPYNLFAMVHGQGRDEVEQQVAVIAAVLGSASRGHDLLYSRRILKKTGLRMGAEGARRSPNPR